MSGVIDSHQFTIVHVDDNPSSMRSNIELIRKYLASQGLELRVLVDEDGKKVLDYLKKELVDVVITDKNISEGFGGIDVIHAIRKKDLFTDILFYSAKGVKPEDVESITYYTFIEIVEDRDIVDRLKKLIVKNLAKLDNISFLRGIVISRVIEVEIQLNDFLVKYFKIPKKKISSFQCMLENKFPIEGKRDALSNILETEGLKSDYKDLLGRINRLQQERNLLAHCKIHPTKPNCLISADGDETYDKKKINGILSRALVASQELDVLIAKKI